MTTAPTKLAQPDLPSPKGQFLVGHTLQYMRDPLEFMTRITREHGDMVRLQLADTTAVHLANPRDISEVLRGHPHDFIKDRLTKILEPVLGWGLVTSDGDLWRRQRKLIQPAFTHQAIQRYGEVMVDLTEAKGSTWKVDQDFDLRAEMMALTLEIVAKTLFDADVQKEVTEVGHQTEVVMDYYLDPTKWIRFREWIPTPSTLKFKRAVRRLNEIMYQIIQMRRESGQDPGDLLSFLLKAQDDEGTGMTDKQLRDEAITLFLAGHETTALTMSFTFFLLAENPEIDRKLGEHLAEVLGDRPPTPADVPKLTYVDWVIKESMRLYPPAWGIGRELLVDAEVGGKMFPKGTQFLMSQWVTHRDPRWFDEPEVFKPERWDHDLIKTLPRGAYFPFGDGPRVCIGNHFAMMEAILLLASISRRFRFERIDQGPLSLTPSITLRPSKGLSFIVRKRCATVGGVATKKPPLSGD